MLEFLGLSAKTRLKQLNGRKSWFHFDHDARLASFSVFGLLNFENIDTAARPLLEQGCLAGGVLLRLSDVDGTTIDFDCTRFGEPRDPNSIGVLLPLIGQNKMSFHPKAASVVPFDADRKINPEHKIQYLTDVRSIPRSDCVFCGSTSPPKLENEHVVPNWALEKGTTALTVKACSRCNRQYGEFLEQPVREIDHRHQPMTDEERFLVAIWTIKTLWAVRESLEMHAALPDDLGRLLPGPPHLRIGEEACLQIVSSIYSSRESAKLPAVCQWGSDADGQWVQLQVSRLVTTLRLQAEEADRDTSTHDRPR